MTETWPPPELRERRNDLGWLAVSDAGDVIRIAVPGATADEAAANYETRRAHWATLAEVDDA